MNSQQICKISRQKDLTEVKIFQKVLGGLLFSWNTPCIMYECSYSGRTSYMSKYNNNIYLL